MPVISIIVPTYNSAKTIRSTLDSVLHQTYKDIEILVVDDGSTDETVEIASTIGDSRLATFSYSNAGQSINRNRGIDRACGDYISFIDSDDLWHPEKLERQLEALQKTPEAAVAYSWTNFIDEEGNFLHAGSCFTVNGDVLPYILLFNFIESGSNFLVRRQALESVKGFDTRMLAAEDWDLGIRLATRYQFVCVSCPHILYRKSRTSRSTNLECEEANCIRVVDVNFDRVPDPVKHLKPASLGNIYKYLLHKCFENSHQKGIGIKVLNFLQKAIVNDRNLLSNKRLVLAILLKGVTLSLLPTSMAQRWGNRIDRKIYPTRELYKFFRTQPF